MWGLTKLLALAFGCAHARMNASAIANEADAQQWMYDTISNLTHYDKYIRSGIDSGTCLVEVTLNVLFIAEINQEDMRYSVGIIMRQFWDDDRLAYNASTAFTKDLTIDADYFDLMWKPDIFFVDASSGMRQTTTRENLLLRVAPSGRILLSERYTILMDCIMDFKLFPFDAQKCPIRLESYAYSTRDLDFKWDPSNAIKYEAGLAMNNFVQDKRYIEKTCLTVLPTGNFSCVNGYFLIKRSTGYYALYAFMPSILCVLVSWAGFWMDPRSAASRTALTVTAYLSLKTMVDTVNAGMPRVSYVKAIDVWLLGCDFFIFFTILEFGLAQYLMRRNNDSKGPTIFKKALGENFKGSSLYMFMKITGLYNEDANGIPEHWIDRSAKRFFPFCFVIFNIAYWAQVYNYREARLDDLVKDNYVEIL